MVGASGKRARRHPQRFHRPWAVVMGTPEKSSRATVDGGPARCFSWNMDRIVRRCVVIAVVWIAGCGPEGHAPAEHGRVCGHDGPWRVLELDEDQAPLSAAFGVRRFGDRIYVIAGDAPHLGDPQLPDLEFWSVPLPEHTTLWSMGPCGESPRELAHDVWRTFEDPRFPGVVFAQTGVREGDVLAIDPEGTVPPRLFLRDVDSLDRWTDHGVVSPPRHDAGDGPTTLRLLPYPDVIGDEPPAPVVLVDQVSEVFGATRVAGDEVFAITSADELVAIDLVDGTEATLATGVDHYDVSDEGTLLVVEGLGVDEAALGGPVDLLDRTAGTTTRLVETGVACCGPHLNATYVEIPFAPESGLSQRIVALPSLEAFDVPLPWSLLMPIDDGAWLATRDSGYYRFDPASSTGELLFDAGITYSGISTAESTELLVLEDPGPSSALLDEGVIWEFRYDGSEPEQLAHRATSRYVRLPDGRVVTPVDVEEDFLGNLVVVEPGTLDERRVDDHVFAALPFEASAPMFDDVGEIIAYAVRDGDRSGLWITTLVDDASAGQ